MTTDHITAPVAPGYLTGEQRDEWVKLTTGALAAGIVLQDVDGPLLELLVVAICEFRMLAPAAADPHARPFDRQNRDRAARRVVSLSDRLGLNPRSRSRLGGRTRPPKTR